MITLWDIAPENAIVIEYATPTSPEIKTLDPAWVQQRVASAYANLFSGNGTVEDADIVLVDMAQFSRYYDTATLDMTGPQALAFAHRRAVLSRMLEALTFGGREPQGLLQAVLRSPPLEES